MDEIHIAGHSKETLRTLLNKRPGELDAIIITNMDSDFPEWVRPLVKSVLHLRFDDVTYTLGRHVMPTKGDIQKALDFAADKKSIVVACHAGVSRSSATAYLIASREWGAGPGLGILKANTHWPNALIVKLGSELLGDKKIWTYFSEWHNKNCGLDPNDVEGINNLDGGGQEQEWIKI